jgi:Mg2+-importing ATPase
MNQHLTAFWSISVSDLLARLQTAPEGLAGEQARERLLRLGANLLTPPSKSGALALLVEQFRSPIILILLLAAGLSAFLQNPTDAGIILAIVLASSLLGFWQEKGAAEAIQKLLAIVQTTAEVLRDGSRQQIPAHQVVPGDVLLLKAGDTIPADCRMLESRDLFVNEAALTGETYPQEKFPGELPPETPLSQRSNTVFMGTPVVSGTAKALAVLVGRSTEFGKVSGRLALRPPETDFERGVRRFGYFLMEVTLLLVVAVFAFNVYLARPVLESFLFALALAVGLTPQLLPAIVTVNLAHGARRMALAKVIVKRLSSIENFGSMNVLCVDKTGTLTEGVVRVRSALDVAGNDSDTVLLHAYLNAFFETGFADPVDDAIRRHCSFDTSAYRKLDEVPYDFIRKRLSILVSKDGANRIVTKGALRQVLDVCSTAQAPEGAIVDLATVRDQLQRRFEALSGEGFRTLGVAYREAGAVSRITKDDEAGMTFLGFLVLHDPVKRDITKTILDLRQLGVCLKIITGDNQFVAAHVSEQVGLSPRPLLTGAELLRMSDEALRQRVNHVDLFAEVEPNQKERIILAMRKMGNVVGYMGDGINDASALHAADVGISVDSAVDVAKEAADIVLLERDLGVLAQAVRAGRMTFANTLKYVFMATSANFGNMFSMAGASLFLPFLPLLPKQILLTNFLTDLPEMTIATDSVDRDLVEKPQRWDIRFIRRFMLTFGVLSSVFDYLTFGVLLLLLHAGPALFRTGWFVESVVSASAVVLVIRTRGPVLKSRPGRYLLAATLVTALAAMALPFTAVGKKLFGFTPLPVSFLGLVGAVVVAYICSAEAAKRVFYRRRLF